MPDFDKSLAAIVGENILNRRKKRNLTQEQLAELVGICQQSLSRMEKGRMAPRFGRLQEFANALGCSVADLFKQGEDEKSPMSVDAIIRPLSADSQQAVVNIVAEMVHSMLWLEKKSDG